MKDNNIVHSLIELLKKSEYWTRATRNNGKTIQGLVCPSCGDKSAWAYAEAPWSINCNRSNECGARTRLKKLFPSAFLGVEKKYKPTQKEPNRPATMYLKTRGIKNAISGMQYKYRAKTRKNCGGAIMFPVGKNNGKVTYNGRLFNPPAGEGKTHNIGSTSGLFWKHPRFKYDPMKETYVTEGIIDALSLIEMGFQAIAVLSSGQDPSKVDLSEFRNLVFAFDNDLSGAKALKKWSEHYSTKHVSVDGIMPVRGDWNDLLTSRPPDKATEYFNSYRPEYKFQADLALSKNAQEYAEIFFNFKKYSPKLFEFDGCYHFAKVNTKKEGPPVYTKKASNFILSVDHYQLDTSIQDEPVYKYTLAIKPHKGSKVVCRVTGKELSTPSNMVTTFLQKAKCLWRGDSAATTELAAKISEAEAPIVRQLQITGLDRNTGCYVFKDFTIDTKGKILLPNSKSFFEVSQKEQIRPAPYATLKPIPGISPKEIWGLVHQAWGDRGAVAFAWMVAGWFVKQIRDELNYFPFLSFNGDTQCGKSALNRILNRCQCLDDEGLPMRKSNTGKGEIRKIAQRSSLFIALIEANQGDSIRLDLENILTWYDGAPLQTRATKTNDIQTDEIPFTSSILFVQNKEPFLTKAQKERVISLKFKEAYLNEDTMAGFNKLMQIEPAQFACFFQFVMRYRQQIESNWFEAFTQAKKELSQTEISSRLVGNHALVLGFHRMLCKALQIDYDLYPYIETVALKKHEECNHRPADLADLFFENVHSLIDWSANKNDLSYMRCIDWREEEQELWVSLSTFLQQSENKGFPRLPLRDLMKSLSEHPATIGSNKSHRFVRIDDGAVTGMPFIIEGKTDVRKAWKFDIKVLAQ